MGRTACTESQCLYKGVLYLLNIEGATVLDLDFDVDFRVRVHNPACSNCGILLSDIGTEFVF